MKRHYLIYIIGILFSMNIGCQKVEKIDRQYRETIRLTDNWQFQYQDTLSDQWTNVTVPHDWAISMDFDKTIDMQEVMVLEDGDPVPKLRTGRTGALPHIGKGFYRKELNFTNQDKGKKIYIQFDGAMSHAKVYLNKKFVGSWPYGYTSFEFDITPYINYGDYNLLEVHLENKPLSSRWYPGAGIYRNVRIVKTNPIHVKQWGTYITTPVINEEEGLVNIETKISNSTVKEQKVTLVQTVLFNNERVASEEQSLYVQKGENTSEIKIDVPSPKLWSPDTPNLYKVITEVVVNNEIIDTFHSEFGFRTIEFTNNDGFFLNGKELKFKGVCLHHDLGPLGAAHNESALRHRLLKLKEMGANAIRSTHNPSDPSLVRLTDELGFLFIAEAFDEWEVPKTENGYNTLWNEWAEKDLAALIHRDRNHPSLIMWSIGNEIREQTKKDGAKNAQFLTDICHREDPSRPSTAGFNNWKGAIANGLADAVDIPGWNYKPNKYEAIHKQHPKWKMYGSETASTVSSRGEYFFPAKEGKHKIRPSLHSNSFDMDFPNWAQTPDREFKAQDKHKFIMGEFVWTGYDYLGEPTPYNEEWPTKSSYFGIIDLAGIPKDRFYLYKSKWSNEKVLHVLPHWNWKEGQTVSVHAYTNYNKAELFINGKSMGIKTKNNNSLYDTYRLRWDNITYHSGEMKVVALNDQNEAIEEVVKQTAGIPYQLKIEVDRSEVQANGEEVIYASVSILDKNRQLCPKADQLVTFNVEGQGTLRAVGNGDPTSLESFVAPKRKAFNGMCMAILQSTKEEGKITMTASSQGLAPATITIHTQQTL
ncbi:glycoside hydrolase family 2 TIM barrel-domain containing protein [Flammeovirga agarivorans]|uniref:Glycoside hydrolase family 2 protein n=1 Tax=Flammeovirga agarivorans TaxID=2726742 RepID=A0A7X8XYX1_9BACT|nr:glycoside hydrolase family 2 TIM barrel-domain containing protein [Flammeovirga agarivorans]NLR94622.1 glycoside hydrolase family 2 protein [Flammeovirga agarivorans]